MFSACVACMINTYIKLGEYLDVWVTLKVNKAILHYYVLN